MNQQSRKPRASHVKVRTGCVTCKIRRVKCDEAKPHCRRCTSTGRKCDGYVQPREGTPEKLLMSRLRPSPTPISVQEARGLEFFFHTTSHQLAGLLERDFWRRSVLQLSLSEHSIRQALAALGSLHESEYLQRPLNTAIVEQLYSQALRSTMTKATTGETAVPIVVMSSILFTSFEFLRGNAAAAATHIASGINLIRSVRQIAASSPIKPWGRNYSSYETQFLDSDLAPILTLFSLNASEFSPFPSSRLILNPITASGPTLPEQFETLREARVALVDLVTACADLFQGLDERIGREEAPSANCLDVSHSLQNSFRLWKIKFQELLSRCESTWSKDEKRAANVIRIMQYGSEVGVVAYLVNSECDWDDYREQYEKILELVETMVINSSTIDSQMNNLLSLESGLIYPMHAVAWKCRYPDLRRRGLDLLLRCPRREWLLDSRQYHAIFSRILEIEESQWAGLEYERASRHNVLPAEQVRVYDFFCVADPGPDRDHSRYAITFMTKPDGPDGDCHYITESIHLPTVGVADLPPSNLISPRRWAKPDTTSLDAAMRMKAAIFGPYRTLIV
ncbi:Zn(II)2Cys6 transcription factor [Aspergillus stella-maris]|uniref:Zn(II)2Cys6 transcription factor n=1 Tax=Aspergillus stella-maris TaxID=1810926 RepID=UPI003CCD0A29